MTEPPGHVTGLVDYSGTAVATYRYADPFGAGDGTAVWESSALSGWTNRLRFGAREYDAETGLYYVRARYYDPGLGRFLSPDPSGLAAGVNWYAYAGNDPVNHTDPTGLDKTCTQQPSVSGTVTVGATWATGGGWTQPFTAGGGWTCSYTYGFDPSTEYADGGFTPGTYGGPPGGGSGGAAPAAPPNHPISSGDAVLLGVGRRLAPAQPWLEGLGNIALLPLGGFEEGGVLLARQLASEELLSQAVRGLGVPIVRGEAIRDVPRLVALYGGEAADWVKMTTGARTAGGIQTAVHWYRNVALDLNLEFKTNLLSRGWWWP